MSIFTRDNFTVDISLCCTTPPPPLVIQNGQLMIGQKLESINLGKILSFARGKRHTMSIKKTLILTPFLFCVLYLSKSVATFFPLVYSILFVIRKPVQLFPAGPVSYSVVGERSVVVLGGHFILQTQNENVC